MSGTEPLARAGSTRRGAVAVGTAGLLALTVVVAACNDDGRELRDPVAPAPTSTTAPPTTLDPAAPVVTDTVPPVSPAALQLTATWPDGAQIPARNTCDDVDLSPALTWANVPSGSVELAITFVDETAGFTHWLVTGINAARASLAESEVPPEAFVRVNDFGDAAWAGPCPPEGEAAHTYVVTLHALNQQLEVADDAATSEVISLLNQTAIAQTSVTGTYARGA